jgi:hypothetical protein
VTRFTLLPLLVTLLASLTSAKRIAPPKVEPVIYEGIRYIAPNEDGRRAYIEAWDGHTNKKLWDLTVFTNRIDPKLEEDVQWIFIKALSVEDGVLLVTAEHSRRYQVDLKTKAIKELEADLSQAPQPIAQHDDIPEVVKRVIANDSLAKAYEICFRMNPFYLHGDFNGDGKTDIAVQVTQRSTGKLGIAVINDVTDKVTIVGAGKRIGNGGDDFEWMDSWEIYSKDRVVSGTGVRSL